MRMFEIAQNSLVGSLPCYRYLHVVDNVFFCIKLNINNSYSLYFYLDVDKIDIMFGFMIGCFIHKIVSWKQRICRPRDKNIKR
jgi:hypothetical protein